MDACTTQQPGNRYHYARLRCHHGAALTEVFISGVLLGQAVPAQAVSRATASSLPSRCLQTMSGTAQPP